MHSPHAHRSDHASRQNQAGHNNKPPRPQTADAQAFRITMEHSVSSTVLSSVGKWLDQRIGRLMGPPTSGPPSNTSNASDSGPPLPSGGPQMPQGGLQMPPGGPHSLGPSGTASPKVRICRGRLAACAEGLGG